MTIATSDLPSATTPEKVRTATVVGQSQTLGPEPSEGDGAATLWSLVKKAASAWIDDYAPSMGAALSYYTVFSLAPLRLMVMSIAGLVFGEEAARGALFGQLADLTGSAAAETIQSMLAGLNKPESGVIGTVIGVVLLLIAHRAGSQAQSRRARFRRTVLKEPSVGASAAVRAGRRMRVVQ